MKITCPQCGFSRDVPPDKLPEGPVIAKCPKCACRFHFSPKNGAGSIVPPEGDADGDIRVVASNAYNREAQRYENEQKAKQAWLQQEKEVNPWEIAPAPDGWLAAFYQTIIRVMFQAPIFFKTLLPQAQIWRPLSFFIIICIFQTLVERAWGSALYSFLTNEGNPDPQLQNMLKLLAPTVSLPMLLLLRTGSLLLQLFIFAAVMYFAYRIVAPGQTRFMLVYQTLAYSAAPWVLCIIPGIGSLAGMLWGIGCLAIGCKTALRLNWPQTCVGFLPLLTVLFPLLPQLASLVGTGI